MTRSKLTTPSTFLNCRSGCMVITREEYEELQQDRSFLIALEAAGLDNWEGYNEVFASVYPELIEE